MPKLSENQVPAYRLHKQSGQAIVTLSGRDILLGPHGTPASRREYQRVTAEWLAAGRRLPDAQHDLTVTELIVAFWRHAQEHYRKADGTPTSEVETLRYALKPLRRLYGATPASQFGPLRLRAVRDDMIRMDWCRSNINRAIGRLRHVFKWAAGRELIPASVYHGLAAVGGLQAGRCKARESEPVKPVPVDTVEATLLHVSPTVGAMIRLQLLTGMRPGEVCAMRGCDLDTTGKLWTYTPATHKTAHHGHQRVIYVGPKAQQVIGPLLKPDLRRTCSRRRSRTPGGGRSCTKRGRRR